MINEKELLLRWEEAMYEYNPEIKKLAIATLLATVIRTHGYMELAEEVRKYFKK